MEKLSEVLHHYVGQLESELTSRWKQWPIDLSEPETHEVLGALLARQVTLATQLALSPNLWNEHVAPIILRTMAETYITLAWVVREPRNRARQFILYGLGQEKLHLEHRKAQLTSQSHEPSEDPVVKATEAWINSQRYTFLTEVNVGSWSGLSVRDMAEEAGCKDMYVFGYVSLSAAVHSMWHHVARYNLVNCESPLHRFHRIPIVGDPTVEPDYLYLAGRYADSTFRLVDRSMSLKIDEPSALQRLIKDLEAL